MILNIGDAQIDLEGYNKCLEDALIKAMTEDNADEAAKIFHLMLCDSGMTGHPKPNLHEFYVDEVEYEANKKTPHGAVFLDATGKPKQKHKQEFDFQLGLIEDVKKYLGLGEWDTENNLVKGCEFFLSTMYTKYGHDATEDAIDYVEGN